MAASPSIKVYNPMGEFVAACKEPLDAARLVIGYGTGATIRKGHTKVVWRMGRGNDVSRNPIMVARNVKDRINRRAWL